MATHFEALDRNPLIQACRGSDMASIRRLLDEGADLKTGDSDGMSPLHHACMQRDSVDLVSLLLERGADVSQVDADGLTPLHIACGSQRFVRRRRTMRASARRSGGQRSRGQRAARARRRRPDDGYGRLGRVADGVRRIADSTRRAARRAPNRVSVG